MTVACREAVTAAPGAPGHVLSYMHALEIMQHYSQVLEAAQELLLTTRCLRCQTSIQQYACHVALVNITSNSDKTFACQREAPAAGRPSSAQATRRPS